MERRFVMRRLCGATTHKGDRCKHTTFPLSNSCWQHTLTRHPYVAAVSTVLGLGLGIVGVWMPLSAEVRAKDSARSGLIADLRQDLYSIDLHVGLVRSLFEKPIYPPEGLLDTVRLCRQQMAETSPPRAQYEIARAQSGITSAPWWESLHGFY